MALNFKMSGTLGAYGDVTSFLLRVYAMDEAAAEAYKDAVKFRQGSTTAADTHECCGIKAIAAESYCQTQKCSLSSSTDHFPKHGRRPLSSLPLIFGRTTKLQSDRPRVLDGSVRTAKYPAAMAPAIEASKKTRLRLGAETLSVETSNADDDDICGETAGSKVLVITSFYAFRRVRNTSPPSLW